MKAIRIIMKIVLSVCKSEPRQRIALSFVCNEHDKKEWKSGIRNGPDGFIFAGQQLLRGNVEFFSVELY
ncbi:hypothetical protein [Parageobacillus thermantarcticus]|uniref:hypothetical protein n=1 Tax=Parageobacillus thermantarcticus TaxID=186116 RepID=UPI00116097F7|nr:hypothetical protein [Parageobacillus thermantarcticus]